MMDLNLAAPEMPDAMSQLNALKERPTPETAEDFAALEDEAARLGHLAAAEVLAHHLKTAHSDRKFVNSAVRQAREKAQKRLRKCGKRQVEITLPGGHGVVVSTPYLLPDTSSKPGPRRKRGGRGKAGNGSFPVLVKLGIIDKTTPRLRFMAALQLVMSDSYECALSNLAEMGAPMTDRAMVRHSLSTASAMMALRDESLEHALEASEPSELPLYGRRVMISTDGGRVKVKLPNTRGRRRKSGRRGFVTEWREPKGIIIQVLDEEGRPDKKVAPVIDFTMGDKEEAFRLLKRYMKALGGAYAEQVLLVADGAEWIWNRADGLREALGVEEGKYLKLLDFYHVCEYLSDAVESCSGLNSYEKREEYKRLKGLLRRGMAFSVQDALHELMETHGETEALVDARRYIENHEDMLDYPKARSQKLPIGSGAMESAVRRVVNLRFKGPGLIWSIYTIEPFMHLRALVKSGRYEDMCKAVLRQMSQPLTHSAAQPESERKAA